MTKLTTERLERKIKNCIEIEDVQVMLPLSAAEELLAFREAAKNPIGSFHISDGKVEATTDYCRDGEWPVQDGEVLVYAAPVLPKQPELVDLSQQVEILNRILNWILKELPVPTQKASVMAIRLSSVIDIISDLELPAPAQPVIPEQANPAAYTDNRNLKSLQKGCNTALLWLKHNAEVGDIPLYTEVPAQLVSEPYKLISVKDDTPTESGDYWCYLGKDFESPTKYRVVHFDVRHHEFQDHRVTHWMRLPAEPEREA